MAALEKIFQLLDVQPGPGRPRAGALELERIRGEIGFEDVSFAYKPRRRGRGRATRTARRRDERCLALDDVDLTIPPGETVALVGATGAGKSTMAKLVARFYDPTSGRVLVDGHDLREVTSESLRSQMGIVPQEAFLFSGTIADNIAFGRPDADESRSASAAAAVGAEEFISELPHGYDTEVGERGAQLSAGQRQLIAFARALIADPRILVLDEATSNVDLHTEGRIEAGPAPPAGGAHRDRDRPPPVDDPPGRPDRRARARPHRRAGHPRRAARRRRAATPSCTATGPRRPRRSRSALTSSPADRFAPPNPPLTSGVAYDIPRSSGRARRAGSLDRVDPGLRDVATDHHQSISRAAAGAAVQSPERPWGLEPGIDDAFGVGAVRHRSSATPHSSPRPRARADGRSELTACLKTSSAASKFACERSSVAMPSRVLTRPGGVARRAPRVRARMPARLVTGRPSSMRRDGATRSHGSRAGVDIAR